MKPKNQNAGGLVGRCILAGACALGGAGCDTTPAQKGTIGGAMLQNIAVTDSSLTYNQAQSLGALGALGGLLGSLAHQEAMKEAARAGRSEVNVYVGGNSNKDVIYLKDGGLIEGDIVLIDSFDIKIRENNFHERLIPRSRIKSYINR